jgi:hypothetical protein
MAKDIALLAGITVIKAKLFFIDLLWILKLLFCVPD